MQKLIHQVALFYDARSAYDLKVMEGVAAFAQQSMKWSVLIEESTLKDQCLPDLRSWKGDGIIADLDNRKVATAVARSKLPAVGFGSGYGWYIPTSRIPYFITNNNAIAAMAADHLLERGFRHFAYYGYPCSPINNWSGERERAFVKRVADRGFRCYVYDGCDCQGQRWTARQQALGNWLNSLPKPIALMAANDNRGRQVIEACRTYGLRVPEDVAVIGVDNDELLCTLNSPELSSVEQGAKSLGFEAATLLDRIIECKQSQKSCGRRFVIDPKEVVTRKSTEILATDDPKVMEAVVFITRHFSEGIKVRDVAKALAVSRSGLESRFENVLGYTVRSAIRRFQLKRAKQLVADTNVPLKQIAAETGFPSVQYMTTVFKMAFGQPPARYRNSLGSCLSKNASSVQVA
jgi:LacI family transcriptional regulator